MTHHDPRPQGKTPAAVVAAIAASTLMAPGMASAAAPQPVNKIVVMVDASGSYRARQAEAVARAVDLLARVAETKLRRWDAGADQIAVVSLDALPEVLWQGTLRDLKAVGAEQWKARFQGRTLEKIPISCVVLKSGLSGAIGFKPSASSGQFPGQSPGSTEVHHLE